MTFGGQGLMTVGGQGLMTVGGQGLMTGFHHPSLHVGEARGMNRGARRG
jgi:hypothetical protein